MTRIKQSLDHPEYIVPKCFRGYPELVALQSTRNGGISTAPYASLNLGTNTGDRVENVYENTRRLCATAGIDPGQMVSSDQVHGTAILLAEKPGRYPGYDGFITDKKNLFLSVFTADCYPVLLFDPRHRAVGAVHAGWKGCAGKIVMKTIEAMVKNFNTIPEETVAFTGTGISATAYEVGPDMIEKFPAECCRLSTNSSPEKDKYLLDLARANYLQLLASAIPEANIEQSLFCSYRDSNIFFSYRRDNGTTGRMLSLIGIRSF
ncbi:MAG: peptidoglycan editing factor PgeF [Chlorobium sp.]|nr:MAG: peptidoglycan editing factor PgeF [Chlorobium sp.]